MIIWFIKVICDGESRIGYITGEVDIRHSDGLAKVQ